MNFKSLRNRLADLLVDGAMWMSGKLYGTTQAELDHINEALDRAEREAAEAPAKEPVVVHRDRAVAALIDGRIVRVRIPRGTTWVDGGSC